MITYSGRTPELILLLQHIPLHLPLIVMTSHTTPSTCPLLNNRANGVLLTAPIPEAEKISFGISAPTTSTTTALVLADALALGLAERLYPSSGHRPSDVFLNNHPGGAIGNAVPPPRAVQRMSDIATTVDDVSFVTSPAGKCVRNIDVLLTAVRSKNGWVRADPRHIVPPRKVQTLREPEAVLQSCVAVEKTDWISVLGNLPVEEVRQWIFRMREESRGRTFLNAGTILGVVDAQNEVSGVVEIEDVMGPSYKFT